MTLVCGECRTALNPEAKRFMSRNLNTSVGSLCVECYPSSPLCSDYEDKPRARDGVYDPRRGYVWPLLSDSRAWMEIATANYEFPEPSATWSVVSKNNIVLTCAGIALEIAYKAILLADGRSRYKWEAQPYHHDMPYKHVIRELHNRLRDDRKAIVDSVIESLYEGSRSALEWYFETVDVYVNHPYRKYWFIGASTVGGFSRGIFQMIQTVHHALMDQAESAWSELLSEYSATASELRDIADRTPAVYDSNRPSHQREST